MEAATSEEIVTSISSSLLKMSRRIGLNDDKLSLNPSCPTNGINNLENLLKDLDTKLKIIASASNIVISDYEERLSCLSEAVKSERQVRTNLDKSYRRASAKAENAIFSVQDLQEKFTMMSKELAELKDNRINMIKELTDVKRDFGVTMFQNKSLQFDNIKLKEFILTNLKDTPPPQHLMNLETFPSSSHRPELRGSTSTSSFASINHNHNNDEEKNRKGNPKSQPFIQVRKTRTLTIGEFSSNSTKGNGKDVLTIKSKLIEVPEKKGEDFDITSNIPPSPIMKRNSIFKSEEKEEEEEEEEKYEEIKEEGKGIIIKESHIMKDRSFSQGIVF